MFQTKFEYEINIAIKILNNLRWKIENTSAGLKWRKNDWTVLA